MTRISPSKPSGQRQPVFKSPGYLKSANGRSCDCCGSMGTTVFAHMRAGNEGGTGLKPADYLGAFLCGNCHHDQESNPGYLWWAENVLKPLMKERYANWEKEQ